MNLPKVKLTKIARKDLCIICDIHMYLHLKNKDMHNVELQFVNFSTKLSNQWPGDLNLVRSCKLIGVFGAKLLRSWRWSCYRIGGNVTWLRRSTQAYCWRRPNCHHSVWNHHSSPRADASSIGWLWCVITTEYAGQLDTSPSRCSTTSWIVTWSSMRNWSWLESAVSL